MNLQCLSFIKCKNDHKYSQLRLPPAQPQLSAKNGQKPQIFIKPLNFTWRLGTRIVSKSCKKHAKIPVNLIKKHTRLCFSLLLEIHVFKEEVLMAGSRWVYVGLQSSVVEGQKR
jgi:hypothetical protein